MSTQQSNSKAVLALVMGIISIVLSWVPIIGTVLGILAIVFANQSKRLIAENPDLASTKGMTTGGLVTGIIGLCLSVIYLIYWIFAIFFFAAVASSEFNTSY